MGGNLRVRLNKTVALIGLMGSGKTAVGTALADRLGVPFVDSDAEIVLAANMTIAEIFESYGEDFFRQKESQVLARLLDGPPAILSTGGGAFLRAKNRDLIDDRGVAVWLNAPLDLLWARVRHKTTRPLLNVDNPYQVLSRLYHDRLPVYRLAKVHVLANENYSVQDMAGAVEQAVLEQAPGILEKVE